MNSRRTCLSGRMKHKITDSGVEMHKWNKAQTMPRFRSLQLFVRYATKEVLELSINIHSQIREELQTLHNLRQSQGMIIEQQHLPPVDEAYNQRRAAVHNYKQGQRLKFLSFIARPKINYQQEKAICEQLGYKSFGITAVERQQSHWSQDDIDHNINEEGPDLKSPFSKNWKKIVETIILSRKNL